MKLRDLFRLSFTIIITGAFGVALANTAISSQWRQQQSSLVRVLLSLAIWGLGFTIILWSGYWQEKHWK